MRNSHITFVRIGTISVCGLNQTGQQTLLLKTIKRHKVNICSLQETRLPNVDYQIDRQYTAFLGAAINGHHGTGIMINTAVINESEHFEEVSSRLCIARIKMGNTSYSLLACYGQTNVDTGETKIEFW